MTPQTDSSIFFDEWQACLRAHYIYVIRADDQVTELTLRRVLLQTGLRERDLDDLRDEAFALGPVVLGETDSPGDYAARAPGVSADAALADEDERDGDEDEDDLPGDDNPQLSLF